MPNEDVTTTELVWPGKKTEVDRVSLPFQTVETVNKPRVDQPRFDFGEWPENYPREWKNKLIWGDNKYVMASLLKDFAGKIDLIYIDPPFATGADFTVEVEIGDTEVTKEASVIEELAYRDTWGKGLQSYLQMMYDRLTLMKELLAEEGSVYVHLDWRVGHYVKAIMDEVFGRERFRNQIIWKRGRAVTHTTVDQFARMHDMLLFFTKSENAVFNRLFAPYADSTLKMYRYEDERGVYRLQELRDYSDESIKEFAKQGRIREKNGRQYLKQYLHEKKGVALDDLWTDIGSVSYEYRGESVHFPTQKPEALLERIINASSNEGDIVADFFCGSGTTGAVAEKLGRRWIMCDLSRFATQTARKRLLNLHSYSEDYDRPARPFEIHNLGNYQKHKFTENGYPPVERYIDFIVKLYRAQRLEGFGLLHGKKGRRLVHVSGVDSIVTEHEVRDAAEECVNALGGKAVDILGWDFEMGLDELVGRMADEYEIDIQLVQIPREATELTSPDAEIRFFDMNYLEFVASFEERKLIIRLKDFVIANMEYLPEEVRESVDSFAYYIDYWAVDFDYKDDTFHNMWQSFRTRERRQLDTACVHGYDEPGDYQVLVKVIDVFGNDTNKLLEVRVG